MNTRRSVHPALAPVLLGLGIALGVGVLPLASTAPQERAVGSAPKPGTEAGNEVRDVLGEENAAAAEERAHLEQLQESIECVRELSETFQTLSEEVGPAVASVTAHASRSGDREPRQIAQGSGIVLSADGILVTNYHVVEDGEFFLATFDDGREFEGAILGTDSESDLAFLQLDGRDFHHAELAARPARVGEFVLALGNPFGMGHSVSSGIVSRLGRRNIGLGLLFEDFIQTNAEINPGNSGGPLIDLFGRVLGMNTAIAPNSQRGISYAIPASMIRRVQQDIIEVGYVRRGYLGVIAEARSRWNRRRDRRPGLRVERVLEESPAEEAGLLEGDVILEFAGQTLHTRTDLFQAIDGVRPGTVVELALERDGDTLHREVTLVQRPLAD